MKITVSNTTMLRKLKEYRCKYEDVLIEKATVSEHLVEILSIKKKTRSMELLDTATCNFGTTTSNQQTLCDQQVSACMDNGTCLLSKNNKNMAPQSLPAVADTGCGMHFVMDNFDLRQEVRDMTADNQNKDFHWTNHNCIRVSGAHLANDKPICKLSDLTNGLVLPNAKDHLKNRDDYIVLVQRILVEHIPALNFLTGAVQKHISHI